MVLLCFFVIAVIIVTIVEMVRNKQAEDERQQQQAATNPEPVKEDPLVVAQRLMQRTEAYIQASIVHDDATKAALDAGTYDGPLPERRGDGGWLSIYDRLRILSIAGINHRQNIGCYTGRNTVAVVPEPKNEFDPGALKVIAEDGHHLGYVGRDHQEMVRSWCHERWPYYCQAIIRDAHEDDGTIFYVGYLYMIKQ
jgi:hypothetical protein